MIDSDGILYICIAIVFVAMFYFKNNNEVVDERRERAECVLESVSPDQPVQGMVKWPPSQHNAVQIVF